MGANHTFHVEVPRHSLGCLVIHAPLIETRPDGILDHSLPEMVANITWQTWTATTTSAAAVALNMPCLPLCELSGMHMKLCR